MCTLFFFQFYPNKFWKHFCSWILPSTKKQADLSHHSNPAWWWDLTWILFHQFALEHICSWRSKTNIEVPTQTLPHRPSPSKHSQFELMQRDLRLHGIWSVMPQCVRPQAVTVLQGEESLYDRYTQAFQAHRAINNVSCINTPPNTLSLAMCCNGHSLPCSISLGLLWRWQTYLSFAWILHRLMRLESSEWID